jgi:peptidoglycan/LPS O-acetylase OafA/YrhL
MKNSAEPLLRPVMPELDAIRGIAILGVVIYHALYFSRNLSLFTPLQRKLLIPVSAGQFGVTLFFVLSGFLITGILLDSRDRKDYFKRFYIRRALRILPVYYLIIIILVLFRMTSGTFLALSLIFSSNLASLFGVEMSYGVLWTLAVEEHFYLLWPSAVRRISSTGLIFISLAIAIASPLLRFHCHLSTSKINVGLGCAVFTWNVADGLAWGAFLALAVRALGSDRTKVLKMSIAFFVVASILTAIGIPFGITTRQTAFGEALQAVPWNLGSAGLIGIALLLGTSPGKKFAAPHWLRFFGWISYGLYVYHLLVFEAYSRIEHLLVPEFSAKLSSWQEMWLRFFIAVPAAVGISYISRRYFEEFFLSFKRRLTPEKTARVAQVSEPIRETP